MATLYLEALGQLSRRHLQNHVGNPRAQCLAQASSSGEGRIAEAALGAVANALRLHMGIILKWLQYEFL